MRGNTAFCGYGALFRRGIIMNITNPKVCIFFGLLPQFCDPAKGTMFGQIIFPGAFVHSGDGDCFFAVSILGGKLAGWLKKSERAQVMIHKVAAMIFVGLALAPDPLRKSKNQEEFPWRGIWFQSTICHRTAKVST